METEASGFSRELPGWLQGPYRRLLSDRSNLPHALMLLGPRGVGKGMLAHRLALSLLCEAPLADGNACGSCLACGWGAQGNHPDLRLLRPGGDEEDGKEGNRDAARQEIKIGQVRALSDFLGVGAHRGGRKIVIIDPADALNVPAANALLKTLEEPASQTIFILVAGRSDSLPATIRSRCVVHLIGLPPREQALNWLTGLTGASAHDATAWLDATGGAPLRAADLADPERADMHRGILQTLAQLPEQSGLVAAASLSSVPAAIWVPMLQAWVAELARVAAGGLACRFPDQSQRLQTLASRTTLEQIVSYAQWLLGQARAVDHPLNPRLFCEDTLLRYRAIFPATQGRTR